jgi:hypothetical protein
MDEFSAYFGEVDDPRAGNARHNLLELIFVALAAVLCGAEDCTDTAEFARAKLSPLRQVVDLAHGPPKPRHVQPRFPLARPGTVRSRICALYGGFCRRPRRGCGD